jgi:hypothetical protein
LKWESCHTYLFIPSAANYPALRTPVWTPGNFLENKALLRLKCCRGIAGIIKAALQFIGSGIVINPCGNNVTISGVPPGQGPAGGNQDGQPDAQGESITLEERFYGGIGSHGLLHGGLLLLKRSSRRLGPPSEMDSFPSLFLLFGQTLKMEQNGQKKHILSKCGPRAVLLLTIMQLMPI